MAAAFVCARACDGSPMHLNYKAGLAVVIHERQPNDSQSEAAILCWQTNAMQKAEKSFSLHLPFASLVARKERKKKHRKLITFLHRQ